MNRSAPITDHRTSKGLSGLTDSGWKSTDFTRRGFYSNPAPVLPCLRPRPLADLLDLEELRRKLPVTRRPVSTGQYLLRAGQPFHALFLVHAGFFKTCSVAEDGRGRIDAFPSRGDLLGMESIGQETYACDAVALDSGEVWELPYPPVLVASQHFPALQATLSAALAAELRRERGWALSLSTLGAQARVAAFLLDLTARQAEQGYSDTQLLLRMTRADIGSFLGLQLETVTRALTHFAECAVIAVMRREIRLLDRDALHDAVRREMRTH